MDLVESVVERVFIQCMGRILRKDPKSTETPWTCHRFKKRGALLKYVIEFNLKLKDVFPWKYSIVKKTIFTSII